MLETKLVKTTRGQIAYKEIGDGVPLLIFHGLFGASANWQSIAKPLSETYRVILCDMRNHGASMHIDGMSYAEMAEDIMALLSALSISKAHLLGHSMGGKAVMRFSLTHPEKVISQLIVDIAPKTYDPWHVDIINALCALDITGTADRAHIDQRLSHTVPDRILRQFLLKNIQRNASDFSWVVNLEAIKEGYDNIRSFPDLNKTVTLPSLFIRGAQSKYILDEDVPLIKQYFPMSQLVTIPNASHWVHVQAPDAVIDIINSFINGSSLA